MPFTYTDADLLRYVKTAASRWREGANLVRVLGAETMKRLGQEGGGVVRRLPALQAAAQKLNLGTVPGQAYKRFADGLHWTRVPEKALSKTIGTMTQADAPRYLFRAIEPGAQIAKPFVDVARNAKPFIHATPNPLAARNYLQQFGPDTANAGALMQVFKPRAEQAYMPRLSAAQLHDNPAALAARTWDKSRQLLNRAAQNNAAFWREHNMAVDSVQPLFDAFEKHVYETPVFQNNKGLGTFLVRNRPTGAQTPSNLAGQLSKGLGEYELARIPRPLKQQAVNMAAQQRQVISPAVQAKIAALSDDVDLQEHQQRVADRVSGPDPRLLLYHGLGSGKSLSAIAAAEAAKKVHGGNYGVVVPASLRGNFQKELKKFTTGSNPEILSYSGMALGKKFQEQPDTLVMDEAQRLRNPESAAARAAREAAQKAKRLVLLSGTPITNSPTDMASLISMLTQQNISPKDFEKRYIGYTSKFPGIIPWLRGAQWGEVPYVKNEKELRKLLQGRVDYQPSKTPEGVNVEEEQVKVPLSKAQQKIQKAIRTKVPPGFLWKLDQEFPMSREELAKMNSFLNGLRQISLSTQAFRADRDPLKAFDQSGKLQEALKNLRKTLDEDERKKALIYSNFIESGIDPYAKALAREGIPYGVFHGGIPTEARQKALRDYNEGKLRALLIGPAGAEGISTKGTNLIQLLDPHWNEARTQQARGRGLRFDSHMGLPEDLRNVRVQRYLSGSEEPSFLGKLFGKRRQRTGDEVLENLAQNKEQLNEAFRKILREVGTPAQKA